YLGERYETVYAVHDNTEHIHSHIIFNSVSFVDGKKYRYEKGDWAKYIQPITNRLCEEYGISTIEIESEKAKEDDGYQEWNARRNGEFVWLDMVKRDVDMCVLQAETFADFLRLIREKGYEVKQNQYLAIKGPGMGSFVRLKRLGNDYTEARIRERIPVEHLSSYRTETLEEAERIVYSQIPYGKRANLSRLQKRYYAKLYRIGLLKRRPYSQAWKYREEIKQMKKLQEQYLFLVDHNIESMEGLQMELEHLSGQKKEVSLEKRRILRKRKKCESLFEIEKQMEAYRACEEEYQAGEEFFWEEHEKWTNLEIQLQEQGYSFEEVKNLRQHFRSETARVRMEEQAITKKLRIAKSILSEYETQQREKQMEEKEKKLEKDQPTR
ncbi:MAG: relaxase/mobilization nuclease domain-containing protein, partial [Lachnospiraceae bacterium]|nr:relaxase/mobilization nuclease domain-containing protein [Lachnospiraceae bacterium]